MPPGTRRNFQRTVQVNAAARRDRRQRALLLHLDVAAVREQLDLRLAGRGVGRLEVRIGHEVKQPLRRDLREPAGAVGERLRVVRDGPGGVPERSRHLVHREGGSCVGRVRHGAAPLAEEREPARRHAAHLPGGQRDADGRRDVRQRVRDIDGAALGHRRELLRHRDRRAGDAGDRLLGARQLDRIRRRRCAPV